MSIISDAESTKMSNLTNAARGIGEGQEVYLIAEYYQDVKISVLEIPRYGWKVKEVENGEATIEYERHNLKLLMSLTVETKYLRKEA